MANEDVAVITELGDRTVATRLQGVAVSREMLASSVSLSSLPRRYESMLVLSSMSSLNTALTRR